MVSLSFLKMSRRPLAREFQTLASQSMQFGISDKDGVLASVEVKSTFVEKIKAKQFEDKKLNTLQNKVVHGEVADSTLVVNRVLCFRGTLCVARVWDLIPDVLLEAYGSRYSIHLGTTKMYHDLRQLYCWLKIKRDIMDYVSKYQNCQRVKYEHQSPAGLL
ncbi:uncharacterized protein LOC124893256 [Capsicum annuum]|uniref:uncharacterized protein LOC124893256 n=1 Tax=Capsicum annuum TaxID=4072 RepID=UPI001FB1213B|nr:uncharacterized protein LOC124893256 [Capsicum annuum]